MKDNLTPVPGKILVSEEEIRSIVMRLGEEITADYAGKKLHLLGILRGAIPFISDLSQYLRLDVTFDFMSVNKTKEGQVRIIKDLDTPLDGLDILLIEDIVNEGTTLKYILDSLSLRAPKSLRVCTMFDRPGKHKENIKLDYVGKAIDNRYAVGYGLDYEQMYRNLPYLAELNFCK
ncbi:MAG: hypoxanthine phosphoribosyltransferase [bacterium]|nr:hypoxanthine phosphoribosyltransferase [bacterium]